jgi:hypothetical protein
MSHSETDSKPLGMQDILDAFTMRGYPCTSLVRAGAKGSEDVYYTIAFRKTVDGTSRVFTLEGTAPKLIRYANRLPQNQRPEVRQTRLRVGNIRQRRSVSTSEGVEC